MNTTSNYDHLPNLDFSFSELDNCDSSIKALFHHLIRLNISLKSEVESLKHEFVRLRELLPGSSCDCALINSTVVSELNKVSNNSLELFNELKTLKNDYSRSRSILNQKSSSSKNGNNRPHVGNTVSAPDLSNNLCVTNSPRNVVNKNKVNPSSSGPDNIIDSDEFGQPFVDGRSCTQPGQVLNRSYSDQDDASVSNYVTRRPHRGRARGVQESSFERPIQPTNVLPENDSSLKCRICGKMYSWKHHLLRHMKFVCGKISGFACPVCPHETKQKDNLKRHIILKHGIKAFNKFK